jgi:hypothetical protein
MLTWVWTSVDYELDWPRELLRSELHALRHHPYRAGSSSEIALLLTEAFHTDLPAIEYGRICSAGEWADDPGPGRVWVDDLLAHVDQLRPFAPRPYWTERRASPPGSATEDAAPASGRFGRLIEQFWQDGYLSRDFRRPCVDESERAGVEDLDSVLRTRLAASDEPLWPLRPRTWDDETFYNLIEIFHDLVARPRTRWEHEFGDCGVHFDNFDTDAGRRVYRALVNRMLTDCGVELRLADTGDDVGRLVHVVDEARADLLAQAPVTADPEVAERLDHAIALFRRRGSGPENKRSAIIVLAGILEQRRTLIKDTSLLTKKDENALFDIANNFALRHHNASQQRDYDPAFLDWIFWWYLATVALTNSILERQPTMAPRT